MCNLTIGTNFANLLFSGSDDNPTVLRSQLGFRENIVSPLQGESTEGQFSPWSDAPGYVFLAFQANPKQTVDQPPAN